MLRVPIATQVLFLQAQESIIEEDKEIADLKDRRMAGHGAALQVDLDGCGCQSRFGIITILVGT